MRKRISKIVSAAKTGHEVYKSHQESVVQKRINEEKIRKYGSLALAQAHDEKMAEQSAKHKRLLEASEKMIVESVRYPEVMSRSINRVAIVTNFSGSDHYYKDAEVTAKTTAQKLAETLESAPVLVVEAIATSPQKHKLANFVQSAGNLTKALSDTVLGENARSIVDSTYQSQFMVITPEQIQQRIEYHEQEHDGQAINYVAVTSALELSAFGVGVEPGILGAQGDTYDQIVGGGIIVPQTTNVDDAWAPVPRA